jgi:hypothetical protein
MLVKYFMRSLHLKRKTKAKYRCRACLSACFIFESTERLSVKFSTENLQESCMANLISVRIDPVKNLLHIKLKLNLISSKIVHYT